VVIKISDYWLRELESVMKMIWLREEINK